MQGPLCFWSPWIDSWGSCEDPTGLGRSRDHRRQTILVETELTGNGGRGEIRRRGRAGVARVAVMV
jgi:hypothetical protein